MTSLTSRYDSSDVTSHDVTSSSTTQRQDYDGGRHGGGGTTRRSAQSGSSTGRPKHYQNLLQYFRDELDRIEQESKERNDKERLPPVKPFKPYVFNSLRPYTDTQTFRFAVTEPDEVRHFAVSRNTAGGPCDPWVSHHMDTNFGTPRKSEPIKNPQTPNSARSSRQDSSRNSQSGQRSARSNVTSRSSSQSVDHDSSGNRTSIYPIVQFTKTELTGQELDYKDVPKIRNEIQSSYSVNAPKKEDGDYRRTMGEFSRRGLDHMDEYTPQSRATMRRAYFAYLQNNPGSARAVRECVRKEDEAQKKDSSRPESGKKTPRNGDGRTGKKQESSTKNGDGKNDKGATTNGKQKTAAKKEENGSSGTAGDNRVMDESTPEEMKTDQNGRNEDGMNDDKKQSSSSSSDESEQQTKKTRRPLKRIKESRKQKQNNN